MGDEIACYSRTWTFPTPSLIVTLPHPRYSAYPPHLSFLWSRNGRTPKTDARDGVSHPVLVWPGVDVEEIVGAVLDARIVFGELHDVEDEFHGEAKLKEYASYEAHWFCGVIIAFIFSVR